MNLAPQLKKSGIQAGDRIAVCLPQDERLPHLLFALWDLGASVCPINPKLPLALRAEYLKRIDPSACIDCWEKFPVAQRRPGTSPDLLLFTSGSTGIPKIAALSTHQLLANAKGAINALDLKPNDEWLVQLPLYHVGGIAILFRCLVAKAKAVFGGMGVTHLSAVPTQLYRASPVYPRLRCLLLGGAPVSRYNPKLPIYISYGLTEMGSVVAARECPPQIDGHYYLGAPLPGREVKIGETGEILVKGPCLFQGYWEEGQLTPPPEWFPTGDIGHIDPREGLTVLGRKDWQFISGGENIQPEEIEKELLLIPGIEEAVVVPQPDPEYGQRPVAVVQGQLDLKTMQTFLETRLPKYKIPVALFRLESLPKKGLKVDRKRIFESVSNSFPAS
jgi:O-succinylbenzoic acid--CoA ligase